MKKFGVSSKCETELSRDLTIHLKRIKKVYAKMCTFIEVFPIIAKTCKQPTCPSTDEYTKCGISAQWHIHSTIEGNKELTHATTQISLENTITEGRPGGAVG